MTVAESSSHLLPARPEHKVSELEAQIEAAERNGATPAQLIEWRQKYLAFVQLAFRHDPYQLARASAKLATAYLAAGSAEAASGHARQAEALLRGSPRSQASSSLMPDVLHTLAASLADCGKFADATAYFKQALSTCTKVWQYHPLSLWRHAHHHHHHHHHHIYPSRTRPHPYAVPKDAAAHCIVLSYCLHVGPRERSAGSLSHTQGVEQDGHLTQQRLRAGTEAASAGNPRHSTS